LNQLARRVLLPPQGFESHYAAMRVIIKFLTKIASGIPVAIIGVTQGLGTKLKTTFSTVPTALK
jgi:hypothetical protein